MWGCDVDSIDSSWGLMEKACGLSVSIKGGRVSEKRQSVLPEEKLCSMLSVHLMRFPELHSVLSLIKCVTV